MKKSNPKQDGFVGNPDEVFEEDQMGVRLIETKDKSQWVIVQREPFALWEIKNRKGGVVPTPLSGAYTETLLAEKAIEKYVNDKAA
jgi:hypothetical protein